MPDCPNCHVELGFGAAGGICPKCLTVYTPLAVSRMPGYDPVFVYKAAELYVLLMDSGALKNGINTIELYDDGVIITSHEALD